MRGEDLKQIVGDGLAMFLYALRQPVVLVVFSSFLVTLGRLTIPGHALTGWPGLYEFLAHAWVGGMLVVMAYEFRWESPPYVWPADWARIFTPVGWTALSCLFILSVFEVIMFLVR